MTTASTASGSQPKGIYYLAFTELWERFSFYGMSGLLALYMTKELLLPHNASQVIGLAALRNMLGLFLGPMTDVAVASMVYGLYAGLVYFTPIIGGWVADRLLGTKRTVMIGVLLMSAGHLAMSFYSTFLIALLLLIVGSGFLKGNISAQIGKLYPADDHLGRSRGFTIFSTGICIGSAGGPFVTGLIAQLYGWHAGFATAAALMLLALAAYIMGQKYLPDDRPAQGKREKAAPLTPAEWRRVGFLLVVIALTIPAEITYPMIWSIGLLWVDKYVDLSTPFGAMPATWFASLDSIGSIIAAPLLIAFWGWQAKRGKEPANVTKIGIGTGLAGVGALFAAWGSMGPAAPHSVGVGYAIAGWLIMGLAWMYYWRTTMETVSKAAPPAAAGTLMGVAFLSPFVAHIIAGTIGTNFDKMAPAAFWGLDAAIGFAGASLILLLRKPLTRELER
ncbi:MAG: peptide MFS transporter [Novosphingobium sp.]